MATDTGTKFRIIADPVKGDLDLPEPDSTRDGDGPYILPIVDEEYGGVIAWADTTKQAERIVSALAFAEGASVWLADALARNQIVHQIDRDRAAVFLAALPDGS